MDQSRAMGMRPIVIDSGSQKKDLCLKMGAEEFIDFKEHQDVAARVKEVAGGVGAHGKSMKQILKNVEAHNQKASLSQHIRPTKTPFHTSVTASEAVSWLSLCRRQGL